MLSTLVQPLMRINKHEYPYQTTNHLIIIHNVFISTNTLRILLIYITYFS